MRPNGAKYLAASPSVGRCAVAPGRRRQSLRVRARLPSRQARQSRLKLAMGQVNPTVLWLFGIRRCVCKCQVLRWLSLQGRMV